LSPPNIRTSLRNAWAGATGKTSEEMLAILEQRIQNDPEREIQVAAEQQRRITRRRLEKLLTEAQ
jgi:2-oxo-4-hydroxy-4-carboxy-5-ureidoimidazoline decarboxylase